ncbi:hypothetical protein Tco_0230197, partial [Tanacetum coccineum]
GRVEKMERNLIERLPFLKDVFASIEDPLTAEALIEPSAEAPATNVLPEKDRWCGTRGKFVRWKGVRVTKASKRA